MPEGNLTPEEILNDAILTAEKAQKELDELRNLSKAKEDDLKEAEKKCNELQEMVDVFNDLEKDFGEEKDSFGDRLRRIEADHKKAIKELEKNVPSLMSELGGEIEYTNKKIIMPEKFKNLRKLKGQEYEDAVNAINNLIKSHNNSIDNIIKSDNKKNGITSIGNTKSEKIGVENLEEYFSLEKNFNQVKDQVKALKAQLDKLSKQDGRLKNEVTKAKGKYENASAKKENAKAKKEYENANNEYQNIHNEYEKVHNEYEKVEVIEKEYFATRQAIKDLIVKENRNNKGLNKDIVKANNVQHKITDPEEYNKYLIEIGEKFGEAQGKERSNAKRSAIKSYIKSSVVSFASEKIDKLSEIIRKGTATLEIAAIKGEELASKENKLKELRDNLGKWKEALTSIERNIANIHEDTTINRNINTDKGRESVNKSAEYNNSAKELQEKIKNAEEQIPKLEKDIEEISKAIQPRIDDINKKYYPKKDENNLDIENSVATLGLRAEIKRKAAEGMNLSNEGEQFLHAGINKEAQSSYIEQGHNKEVEKEIEKHKADIERMSDEIKSFFTEENLSKADTLISVVEVGTKLISKVKTKISNINSDKEESNEETNEESNDDEVDVDFKAAISNIKEKLKESTSNEKKGNLGEDIVDIARMCNKLIEDISNKIKPMVSEAKIEYECDQMILKEFNDIAEKLKDANTYTDQNNKTKEIPKKEICTTALTVTRDYIINTGERAKKDLQKEIDIAEKAINITNDRKSNCESELNQAKENYAAIQKDLSNNKSSMADKEKEVQALKDNVDKIRCEIERENEHREHQRIVRDNVGKDINSVVINSKVLEDKSGIKMLSELTGVSLGEDSTSDDLMKAVNKIYINGVSVSKYLKLDPQEIVNKLKDSFERILNNEPNVNNNEFYGNIISVENENFLLQPVVLENNALSKPEKPKEPEKLKGIGKWRENQRNNKNYEEQMEEYKKNLEDYNKKNMAASDYNSRSQMMCADLNKARETAALAEYDNKKINEMLADKKEDNVRKITLDDAIRLSRGEEKRTLGVSKPVEHKAVVMEKAASH